MERAGKLEVICGCMFSGKSEELIRRLKRAELAKRNVATIKHNIDDRHSVSCISSHNGSKREADIILKSEESLNYILQLADSDVEVIGIDEVQFFPDSIVNIIAHLVDKGKRVIVAGLDMDFRGEPFGVMPPLMAVSDEVEKLQAVCVQCGDGASFTQRLLDGQAAKYDDPIIQVGAQECYEARCRSCFHIEKPAFELLTEASFALV